MILNVFPAHAGMSRPGRVVYDSTVCFPRPRGDEPLSNSIVRTPCTFSPPARG